MATLKELREERIKKLNTLRDLGINPFPPHSNKELSNSEIVENFEKYEGKEYSITGRIMSWRKHGRMIFGDIHDFSGKIQVFIKEEELNPTNKETQELGFEHLSLLDIGDFIEARGEVVKTKTGEVSIVPHSLKILTKAIRPLPEKREGLKDRETIFRRRYLDLAMNREVRDMFVRKAKFWHTTREFLQKEGFIELETPILEHTTGGADAKPFATHHEALDENFYMRISSELQQKRLIGGGFEKIYVYGPNFRNEGIDDEHLQEFMDIEWYWAYADYRDNMELVKRLFRHVAKEVFGRTKFTRGEHTFDLADEWKELEYAKAIEEEFGVDIFTATDKELENVITKRNIKISGVVNRQRIIDNLWKYIRSTISGPVFLVGQPKFISPLAKSMPENEALTERFQVIIAGSELGNGYSELNDPFDQLARFQEQQNARDEGDDEAQMLDIDFVEMLEYGMPPTSGYGQSERVFWFLEGVTAREGVFFPQMRRKIDDVTKEIYGLDFAENTNKPVNSTPAPRNTVEFTEKDAKSLLEELVKEDYQITHANMVADAMRAYANKLGENENLWYITGLLHDIDYFVYPDEHPSPSISWFKTWGFPEEMIHAVEAHAYNRTNVLPKTKLASALIAVDELAGFLYAYSLMRPEGFEDMKVSSVKKKFKDKAFARKVNRDEINFGVESFGVDFGEHIEFLINVFSKK